MKKNVLFLIIISLLFISLNVSAQNSMLFSKDQFQNKFNQNMPSLNTQQQGQFQQQMQSKKQQAIQKVNTAPDMSMGQSHINGLQNPNMNQIDKSQYEGFHFNKEQVTPDKFKQDFAGAFENNRKQNSQFGQNGINQAKNFNNSLPKDEIRSKFDNNRSGFENQFTNYKENNSKDLHSSLGDFESKFASFKKNNNSNKDSKLSDFKTKYQENIEEVNGPNRFENGEIKEAPGQKIAKETWNVYNGKTNKTSNVNLGEKPEGWSPSMSEQFGEFMTEFKTVLPGPMKNLPMFNNQTNQNNDPIPEPQNENDYKQILKDQLSNKTPGFFGFLD